MCVYAFGWTNVYREETWERNANVGKWPALPPAFLCLLAHKRLFVCYKSFCFGRRTESSLRSCAFHFNLHCTLTTGWYRPVCDLCATELYSNTAGHNRAVSQFVCTNTLGSRTDERKWKKKLENLSPSSLWRLPLLQLPAIIYNNANIARPRQSSSESAREMQ